MNSDNCECEYLGETFRNFVIVITSAATRALTVYKQMPTQSILLDRLLLCQHFNINLILTFSFTLNNNKRKQAYRSIKRLLKHSVIKTRTDTAVFTRHVKVQSLSAKTYKHS